MKKLAFLILVLIVQASLVSAQGDPSDLSVKEFKSRIDANPEAVILDVRTADELKQEGLIPNARQIDFFGKSFEKDLAKLDPAKTYLIYCGSGYRSGETRDLLRKKGFKNVYHLAPGFGGWKKARMPIVPYKGA